jgi:hypothetical protein
MLSIDLSAGVGTIRKLSYIAARLEKSFVKEKIRCPESCVYDLRVRAFSWEDVNPEKK